MPASHRIVKYVLDHPNNGSIAIADTIVVGGINLQEIRTVAEDFHLLKAAVHFRPAEKVGFAINDFLHQFEGTEADIEQKQAFFR